MEFKMYFGSFNAGKVIFELDNIPFKKEGLVMGRLPSSDRIQIDYIKPEYKNKEFLVIKCLNCGLYLVDNDNDSQIDCPFCGYSNELTDIRVEWWDVGEVENGKNTI